MTLSDNRFTVSELTGEVVEPFNETVIATLKTEGLSDDTVKSELIDWAADQWATGEQELALQTLALAAAENIDRVDAE
jgi:hypothetical protein